MDPFLIWFALLALMALSAGIVFYQIITPSWLKQFSQKSKSFVEMPNGPIALLLVAIAEIRGPITILERSIIERQLTSNLSIHAEATVALVDQAIDTVSVESSPLSVLKDVASALKHKTVSVERQQYLAMAPRVARAHNGPTPYQQAEIDKLAEHLRIQH